MNWRELAKLQKWNEISSWRVPKEDLPELLDLLSEVVPTGDKGDGVETYIDFIDARSATSYEIYYAANLLHNVRERLERTYVREPISGFLRRAVLVAEAALERNGISYQGMHNTFLYWNDHDECVQLEQSLGAALYERKERWSEELIYQSEPYGISDLRKATIEYNRRLRLYPWRNVDHLYGHWHMGRFQENSELDHAINLLHSSSFLSAEIRTIRDQDHWGELGNRGQRAISAIALAQSAFIMGREYEAIRKKKFEPHAVRGMKTAASAIEGGHARGVALINKTSGILREMRAVTIAGHSVKRAAEIVYQRGFGTSADANRKLWSRRE